MGRRVRFGVCLEEDLVGKFDEEIQQRGYNNRSKAIGDLIRDWLIRQKINLEGKTGVGVITLLYDHEVRATTDVLLDIQHSYSDQVVSNTHIHLDPHICLEVLIVKGELNQVKQIADRLSPVRGVKQVQVNLTTHQV